jgi:hypothetical protein
MEDAIIGKLRDLLRGSIDSECKVVYLLAETRKLLDKRFGGGGRRFFALRLFCHWALHVDLSRSRTTTEFLRGLDEFVVSTLAGTTDFLAEQRALRELSSLNIFREQIRDFLNDCDLPLTLCEADSWATFLRFYSCVVEDGSLSNEICARPSDNLRLVERVLMKKATALAGYLYSFFLAWEIKLKDGRILDVSASADDNLSVASGIKLRT